MKIISGFPFWFIYLWSSNSQEVKNMCNSKLWGKSKLPAKDGITNKNQCYLCNCCYICLYLCIVNCESQESRSQSQLNLNTRQEAPRQTTFHTQMHTYRQFRVATWLIHMSLDCEETRAPTVSPCTHWENTHTVRSHWLTQGSNWGPSCCELTMLTNSPLPYPDLLNFFTVSFTTRAHKINYWYY